MGAKHMAQLNVGRNRKGVKPDAAYSAAGQYQPLIPSRREVSGEGLIVTAKFASPRTMRADKWQSDIGERHNACNFA